MIVKNSQPAPAAPAASARRAVFTGLGVGAVALLVGFGALWLVAQAQTERARADARVRAETFATRLADSLYAAEHTVRVLAGLRPQAIASQEVFERVTRDLKDVSKEPLVMQWAPQAVVRYSHPLAGNERAIGLDLRADPRSRELVEAIIALGRGRWDGPFLLRQGGLGMVYRVPVYRDEAAATEENFLGLATTLVNLSVSAQTLAKEFPRHTMRVTARAGTGKALEVWGEPAAGASEAAALAQTRYVPQGEASAPEAGVLLEVAATPRAPAAGAAHWPALLGVALLALLAGWLAFAIESRRAGRMRLAESEAENRKLALAIARTDNAVILTDAEGRIEWVNEGFARITGYSAAEALGRKPGDILQGPQTDPETVRRMSAAIRAGEGFQVEILNYTKAGRSYWLSIEAQPLHDAGGRLTGFMAIEADITERKLAAEKLASEQARLQAVIDTSPAVIYACRLNGDWPATFISANVTEQFGYSPQECLHPGWWESTLHPEDRDRILAGVAALLEKGRHVHEYRMATKAGDWRWVHDELILLRDAQGKPLSATGALLDITERKLAESAQQQLLAERTTLLDEVHHRVKNNLQVVSSLLMLQQGSSQDATLIEQLQLSRDRVAAIAQVHEQLYRTQNFAQVDFGDYLRDLLAGLARSSSASEKNIELQVLGGGVVLTLGEAVPCALLVNELVSNALKHAFPAGRSGRVWVELALGEDGSRTVRVGDDGVGLAPNADATAPLGQEQGLGLTLVRRLSAQLQGTLERQATEVGTLWCLRLGRMMEQERLASL